MSDTGPPDILLPEPDPAFRLSAGDRARLHPADDPELVASLLGWIRPEHRPDVLDAFTSWSELGGKVALGPIDWPVPDPRVREILRRINLRRSPTST